MSVFAIAMSSIFADPNMAVAAVRDGITLRVILSNPDEISEFRDTRIVSTTLRGEVMIGSAPDLADGDVLTISGADYRVQGVPISDVERLTFAFDLVPV